MARLQAGSTVCPSRKFHHISVCDPVVAHTVVSYVRGGYTNLRKKPFRDSKRQLYCEIGVSYAGRVNGSVMQCRRILAGICPATVYFHGSPAKSVINFGTNRQRCWEIRKFPKILRNQQSGVCFLVFNRFACLNIVDATRANAYMELNISR